MGGNAEKNDAAEALLDERSKELFESVNAPPALTRKTSDLDSRVWLIGDEDRVHEHIFGESMLRLPGARERVLVAALENRAVADLR